MLILLLLLGAAFTPLLRALTLGGRDLLLGLHALQLAVRPIRCVHRLSVERLAPQRAGVTSAHSRVPWATTPLRGRVAALAVR
jgi:hypothetical protein